MDYSKKKLIIVEGAQGVGKSTLTNALREAIRYSNLFRLSGNGDNSDKGAEKSFKAHSEVLSAILSMHDCGLNFILDRSYLSELVYSMYTGSSFMRDNVSVLESYMLGLCKLYDVTLILLTADFDIVGDRLSRIKQNYNSSVKFNTHTSTEQQDNYKVECKALAERTNINLLEIDTTHLTPYQVRDIILDIV